MQDVRLRVQLPIRYQVSVQGHSYDAHRDCLHVQHPCLCPKLADCREVCLGLFRQIGNGVGKTTSNDISDFQNALWLTIITMTTVGYGDYYPRTTFGRVIDVLLVVWGTFIVSLMVVVLTNTLNMDQSEKRALIVLNRL